MSEYQYYEFLALDKPLDDRQLAQVRALSTRAEITSTSFVNEYHWGDFQGDPAKMMKTHYDAFLYYANFGTRRVMFRLPGEVLTPAAVQVYCPTRATVTSKHVILDLWSDEEPGGWDGQEWHHRLASIAGVRAELAAGDLRVLYLAWLLAAQAEEVDYDVVEPPVPAGLRELSPALTSLVEFLRIENDLFEVAAGASKPLAEPGADELSQLIGKLPGAAKDAWLLRAAKGEHVRSSFLREIRGEGGATAGTRTLGELMDAADELEAVKAQLAKQKKAADQARRGKEAAKQLTARLDELGLRGDEAWDDVRALIDTKKPVDYDAAVQLLKDLQMIDERAGNQEVFDRRFADLREEHRRKPSLMERFDNAKLSPAG